MAGSVAARAGARGRRARGLRPLVARFFVDQVKHWNGGMGIVFGACVLCLPASAAWLGTLASSAGVLG